jgi:hypothetical protein
MHWFRLLLCAVALLALASCASSDTPTPEESGEAAPVEQPAEQVTEPPATPAEKPSVTEMAPCKLMNVEDAACTTQLGNTLTEILIAQGEGATSATEAGQAISSAIQNAPVDKRNGFKMKGLDTGNTYSFFFQNINEVPHLMLFQRVSDDAPLEVLDARPLTSCQCVE